MKRASFSKPVQICVCEEDPYLLELIRYIHLNPLRAGLVSDLKELDKYLWTGHSALLGKRKSPLIPKLEKEARANPENPAYPARPVAPADGTGIDPVENKSLAEKTIEDVLKHFGETLKEARQRYPASLPLPQEV